MIILDLEINFYLNKRQLNEDDYVEINYYKIFEAIS